MMKGFIHTEIEKIPENWEIDFFKNLADYNLGRTPARIQKKYWNNGEYNWVSISDMEEFGTIISTKESVTEEAHYNIFKNKIAPEGTLLMSFKLTIGRTSILNIDAYHNETIISIYPNHKRVLKEYLFYFLPQLDFSKYHDRAVKGKTLNKSKIDSLEILLPSLPEQRKIVYVLSTVQKAIEQQDKLIRTTTELKKALMQKLFTEGTRGESQRESEIGLVPESWEIEKLKDYCELITKGSSPKWQGFNYCDDGLLFIRSQNIGWGIIENKFAYLPIKFNEIQKRSILKENDVLINLVGASIGRVAIAPKYFEGANTNQAVALVRLEKANLKEKFLMNFLLTSVGQTIIKSNEKDIARANISLNDISNFPVPVPSLEEQNLISNSIEVFEDKIKILNRKKQTLTALFKTLLHELMTGQRRVHELEFDEINIKVN